MAFEELQNEDLDMVPACDEFNYETASIEQLVQLAAWDVDARKELTRRYGSAQPRSSDFNYELRHPGHADQSVHNPHKGVGAMAGAATGFGLGKPVMGSKRMGAGDDVPFPKKGTRAYDELVDGSAGPHLVKGADGEILGFTPERQALHDKIVAEHVLDSGVPGNQQNPDFVMLGGGSGAGKSTLVNSGEIAGLPREGSKTHVVINPDDIKQGNKGTGIPEFKQKIMAGDKEASYFVHEESSFIAKRVQSAAIERKQNIMLDATGDSGIDSLGAKVAQARSGGYSVKGVYVTVPTAVGLKRVVDRGKVPLYPGAPIGRVVRLDIAEKIHANVSTVFPQAVEAKLFDSLQLWDTRTTGSPKAVFDSLKGGVLDVGLWGEFLDKAKSSN